MFLSFRHYALDKLRNRIAEGGTQVNQASTLAGVLASLSLSGYEDKLDEEGMSSLDDAFLMNGEEIKEFLKVVGMNVLQQKKLAAKLETIRDEATRVAPEPPQAAVARPPVAPKAARQGTKTLPGAWGGEYVGELDEDGKAHGKGTCTCEDGEKYVGEYKDDKRNGQGTSTLADGRKYVGEWKDDKKNGQGTFTLADGSIDHAGEWKDGNSVR